MHLIASCASSSFTISTNPKPLLSFVSRSLIILSDFTGPKSPKTSVNSASFTSGGSPAINTFVMARRYEKKPFSAGIRCILVISQLVYYNDMLKGKGVNSQLYFPDNQKFVFGTVK